MELVKMIDMFSDTSVGLGTWQINDRDTMKQLISAAFNAGYRLIDTAAAYSNEIAIAKAVETLGINRHELILSDKAWNTNRGYENVQEACRRSLKKLKTDYLDVYMIHWPASPKLYDNWRDINAETWRGMEQLYKDGLVRAIGVCNFKTNHLEELKKSASIFPMVEQVEYHPGLCQDDILEYCHGNNIVMEASSPLGNGQILRNEVLISIASKYGKSVAQVCLRWANQKDILVIPKTTNVSRLVENMDIFDFKLAEEDMRLIDTIPYCGGIGIDSDEVTEFG